MAYHFRPMAQADAEAVAGWRYPEPFSFYDWTADEDDLAELLDADLRGEAFFAVEDDASRIGNRQADGHVERRRLAGAVRPEQADDLAGVHFKADATDNRAAAV